MNIAIIGYGKMGHEIEKAAKARGISVSSIIDPNSENAEFREINEKSMENADVCLDFTHPESVLSNIEKISKFKKNVVIGTTGWYDNLEQVKKIVEENGIGLIYASNFSIGVNAFFKIIENAAKIMNKVDAYDAYGYELHHSRKVDSPSGTAKTIGNILIKNIDRKSKLVFDRLDRKIEPDELQIVSVRSGFVPGTHVVGFDSSSDTIELKHMARGREGFAMGALMAAEWVHGKKGFHNIDEMMNDIIS
jgi:4-hydroxy-tetrahydrodipicolinate reductase